MLGYWYRPRRVPRTLVTARSARLDGLALTKSAAQPESARRRSSHYIREGAPSGSALRSEYATRSVGSSRLRESMPTTSRVRSASREPRAESGIVRMSHDCIRPGRNYTLSRFDVDVRGCKRILAKRNEDDPETQREENVSCDLDRDRHVRPAISMIEQRNDNGARDESERASLQQLLAQRFLGGGTAKPAFEKCRIGALEIKEERSRRDERRREIHPGLPIPGRTAHGKAARARALYRVMSFASAAAYRRGVTIVPSNLAGVYVPRATCAAPDALAIER